MQFPGFFPSNGTFVPTDQSGAGRVLSVIRASYTRVGSLYLVDLAISYDASGSGANAKIGLGALPSFVATPLQFPMDYGAAGGWGYVFPIGGTNTFNMGTFARAVLTNVALSAANISCQFQLPTV